MIAVDPLDGVAEMLHLGSGVLGPITVLADRSWPHRESTVLEVMDDRDGRWILKRCRQKEHFDQETAAYRDWVGHLAGMAPTVLAADPTISTMVMTREPGEIAQRADAEVHRQAGVLIRRLHSAAEPRPALDFAESMRERLEQGLRRASGLFDRGDVDFVRAQVASLAGLPAPVRVPTHQDNQPRNWLVDGSGSMRLIDFGLSRWDIWIRDLLRLYFWDWQQDPELEPAFLDGYGRRLEADDWQLVRSLGALTAIMTVLWAHDHGAGAGDFAQRGWKALEVSRAGIG